jgi:hypothetical protein
MNNKSHVRYLWLVTRRCDFETDFIAALNYSYCHHIAKCISMLAPLPFLIEMFVRLEITTHYSLTSFNG